VTADVQNVRIVTQQPLRYVGNPEGGMQVTLKAIPVCRRLNDIVDPSNFVCRTWIDCVDGVRRQQQ
jgi:hypothetical protein